MIKDIRDKYNRSKVLKEFKDLLDNLDGATEEERQKNIELAKKFIQEAVDTYTKTVGSKRESEFDRSLLPKEGVVAKDEKVFLSVIDSSEKGLYKPFCNEEIDSQESDEECSDSYWNSLLADKSFVCSIFDSVSNSFVGYCMIKDLSVKEWEIAIELLDEYRNKGYGTASLNLFMDKITQLTGNRFYRLLVDIDNIPSQKMIKKVGGFPDGLAEYLLSGEKLEEFKAENMNLINDSIRELAEEFLVEPEDLIGMVLQYRVDRQN